MTRNDLLTLAQRLREYNHNPHHINPTSEAFHNLIAESASAISMLATPPADMGGQVEVVANVSTMGFGKHFAMGIGESINKLTPGDELMAVAQHQRIVAALSAQQSAHVSVPECKLGIRGRADNTPSICRAYTYTEQPNNDHAWELGKAASAVKAGGDYIDIGLSLLKQLQANGFGVFELRALLNGGEA